MNRKARISFCVLALTALSFSVWAQSVAPKPYFGDQLDDLLDAFYTTGEFVPPLPTTELLDTQNNTTDLLPTIDTANLPADVQTLVTQIQTTEAQLLDYDFQISQSQRTMAQLQDEKDTLQQQLQFMDAELGLLQQKIQTLQTQTAQWEDQIIDLTREKSEIKAIARYEIEQFENKQRLRKLRENNFGSDGQGMMLRWILSDKNASTILDEKTIQRFHTANDAQNIELLKKYRAQLDTKELQTALLYHQLSTLKQNLSTDKYTLTQLTTQRANLLAQTQGQLSTAQSQLFAYQNQRLQALSSLKQLQKKLEYQQQTFAEIETENASTRDNPLQVTDPSVSYRPFVFPMPEHTAISADYLDAEYELVFGLPHNAIDFPAPQDTPVLAAADGVVQEIFDGGNDYSYMILSHPGDIFTLYGHLSGFTVSEGDTVTQSQPIALSGGTPGTPGAGPLTTGAHLHFEVYANGDFADPMQYLPVQ